MTKKRSRPDFFSPSLQEVRELTLGEHDLVVEHAVTRRSMAWDDRIEFFGIVLRSTESGLQYGQRFVLAFFISRMHPKFQESAAALRRLGHAARSFEIARMHRDVRLLESGCGSQVHYNAPVLKLAPVRIDADVRAVVTKPLRHAWPVFSELIR